MSNARVPRRSSYVRLLAGLLLTIGSSSLGCRPLSESTEPEIVSSFSEADLDRGAYLVHQVALCTTCHAQRDWSLYSGPPVAGTEGLGGVVGLFGSTEMAPAIDAESLVAHTVEELAALLGPGERGAWTHQADYLTGLTELSAEDRLAVAAYLKSRPPDRTPPPESLAPAEDPVPRGEYLVRVGRCATCHGADMSGGLEIEIPLGASSPSANITVHPTAGVGRMNREEFIDYFKSLDSPDMLRVPVREGTPNTAMPWPWLAAMTRDDLGAIYDYLATLPAVDKVVAVH